MIRRLRLQNFKSLREADLAFGPLNVFVGPNGSGKSNVFDALLLLHGQGANFAGQGSGGLESGKWSGAISDLVRGGRRSIRFHGAMPADPVVVAMTVPGHDGSDVSLSIRLDAEPSARPSDRAKNDERQPSRDREADLASWLASSPTQAFDLEPARLRAYAEAVPGAIMDRHGNGFAALIATICQNPEGRASLLAWLQELRPSEITDVYAKPGAQNDVLFALREGEQEYTAGALSDGTLRFAALVAAFFQPRPPKHLLIEEVENGISPHRLRVLVELLRSQSSGGGPQVFVTTHSPLLLAWLTDEEHRHTFYFHRDPATGESHVRPVTEIEGFSEAIRSSTLGDLLAEGWMEAVL